MSEKQTGNNIDEIFRKGIEPLNTEPSDEFWRKSAEGIIRNGKIAGSRNTARWRALALLLGAGLLILGFFTIKMQSSNEKTDSKIVAAKNNIINNSAIPVTAYKNTDKPVIANGTGLATTENKKTIKQPISTHNNHTQTAIKNKVSNKQQPSITGIAPTQIALKKVRKKSKPSELEQITNTPVPANSKIEKETVTDNLHQTKTITADPVNNNPIVPELKPANQNTSSIDTKSEAASIVSNPPKTNPAQAIIQPDSAKKVVMADTLQGSSRFSLWAYFSPDLVTGYNYKSSGNTGSYYENQIKTNEKVQSAYSAGGTVEYELNKHLSVAVGLSYQYYSFRIGPTYIYAQQEDNGQIGYSIVSSSGVVNCPYYGYAVSIGDSLKMSATSTRAYLSIPVKLKYFAVKTDKISMFITGGIGINISTSTETVMNWKDSWNYQGTSTVNTIEGLQSMYYSYTLGLGISYNICKQVGIYAEPALQGSLTTINKNTPVVTYPYLAGLNIGVTYCFK